LRPVLLQLAPASPKAFIIACVIAVAIFAAVGALLVRSARKSGSDPLAAIGSLVPALIMGCAFLYYWRGNTIRVYTYGVMLLVAFGVAWLVAVKDAPRFGWKPEQITDIAMIGLALGVVLARLFYVALNRDEYAGDWKKVFYLMQGGLTFHGAVTGAVITAVAYTHFSKISFWKLGDFLAPHMFLGYAIGRIGCFLNGCCYGTPTTLPWGVKFMFASSPPATTTFPVPIERTLNGEVWSRDHLHPAQLYATIVGVTIFFVMRHLRSRFANFDARHPADRRLGRLVAAFFFFFGVERFITEFFRRGVTAKPLIGFVTEAQAVSLGLIIAGVVIYKWRMSLPPEPEPEHVEATETRKTKKPKRNLVL
jgi:phosphatidylglycerol:prolipoprotein diacylglycerol transferase